jgi:hypothetical protein
MFGVLAWRLARLTSLRYRKVCKSTQKETASGPAQRGISEFERPYISPVMSYIIEQQMPAPVQVVREDIEATE